VRKIYNNGIRAFFFKLQNSNSPKLQLTDQEGRPLLNSNGKGKLGKEWEELMERLRERIEGLEGDWE
jgi:hypothetical protein